MFVHAHPRSLHSPSSSTVSGDKWAGGRIESLTSSPPSFNLNLNFNQGTVIVHPPYHTDELHWNRIPAEKITAPQWPALDDQVRGVRRSLARSLTARSLNGPLMVSLNGSLDQAKIHPCDLQMSMKKGCAWGQKHADAPSLALLDLDSDAHKKAVRRVRTTRLTAPSCARRTAP